MSHDKSHQDEASEPFLDHQDATGRSRKQSRSWVTILLLHWLAIGLLATSTVNLYLQSRDSEIFHSIYSPAQEVVREEAKVFTSGFGQGRTGYMGEPTPENEAAWSDLYNFGISRIPESAAARLVNKTVPIPDDPGYYAVSLNVFHQLHCLNMIRKRLYSTEDFDRKHELMGFDHLEHCVDSLRQSLMCASDITPMTWVWDADDHRAKEVAEVAHTCRDFGAVKKWAEDNRAMHFDRSKYVQNNLIG